MELVKQELVLDKFGSNVAALVLIEQDVGLESMGIKGEGNTDETRNRAIAVFGKGLGVLGTVNTLLFLLWLTALLHSGVLGSRVALHSIVSLGESYHEVDLGRGPHKQVVDLFHEGLELGYLLIFNLVSLNCLDSSLDVVLLQSPIEEYETRIDALLSQFVSPLKGFGVLHCKAHQRVGLADPQVFGDVIELSVHVPQDLGLLRAHQLGVSVLLQCFVEHGVLELLIEFELLLVLLRCVLPVDLGLEHGIELSLDLILAVTVLPSTLLCACVLVGRELSLECRHEGLHSLRVVHLLDLWGSLRFELQELNTELSERAFGLLLPRL